MRWEIPEDFKTRKIKKFATLPIYGKTHVYWLEWVDVIQIYRRATHKWKTVKVAGVDIV